MISKVKKEVRDEEGSEELVKLEDEAGVEVGQGVEVSTGVDVLIEVKVEDV